MGQLLFMVVVVVKGGGTGGWPGEEGGVLVLAGRSTGRSTGRKVQAGLVGFPRGQGSCLQVVDSSQQLRDQAVKVTPKNAANTALLLPLLLRNLN